MIGLIARMLWARRGQALTVLMLSVFAAGAAVAGPAAVATVDRFIVDHEVASASANERTVVLSMGSSQPLDNSHEFGRFVPLLLDLKGFTETYSTEFVVIGAGSDLARLVFREDVCAHLTIVAGRCLGGTYEVVVGEQTAQRSHLVPGSVLHTDEVRIKETEYVPVGNPRTMVVVGVYRVTAPTDPYWGTTSYVGQNVGQSPEVVFTTRDTAGDSNSIGQQQSLEAVLRDGVLAPDNVGQVRAEVDRVRQLLAEGHTEVNLSTGIDTLLDRVEASRSVAHLLMPVAFVPLVALCLFVIYLAVGYGTVGRRYEIGLVTLRGVGRTRRFWLATGEPLAMILIGAPIGYLLGHVAVASLAWLKYGDATGAGPQLRTIPFALAALAGAVLAAMLAQRQELRTPVVDLLRRVPSRTGRLRIYLVESLFVVLTVVAVIQLRGLGGGLTGVASLVPGLIIASVAVVAARAVVPATDAVARATLHRGRLGWSLAAVQLARRPGSGRLLILLIVATALLGFSVAGLNVADQARRDRAGADTGAATVVEVSDVDARTLLAVVRAVDPAGAYAMAVARTPAGTAVAGPPTLAVDAPRLPTAAIWHDYFGIDPAEPAGLLHPAVPASFVLRADDVSLDVETPADAATIRRELAVSWEPLAGGAVLSRAIDLRPGRHQYRLQVSGCANGCRLVRLWLRTDSGRAVEAVVHDIRSPDATSPLIPRADLTDPQRWRVLGDNVQPLADGLKMFGSPTTKKSEAGVWVVDAPIPLPVIVAGAPGAGADTVSGFDGRAYPSVVVAKATMLPRVGSAGTLVDLEYLGRTTAGASKLTGAEVWLGPAAPADTVARLRAAGLTVTATYGVERELATLSRQGSAVVLWFYAVAAGFAVLLALGGMGLVASVDRDRSARDLRYLRWQGLSRRDLNRASLWGNLVVVLVGGVLGLGAAWLAWLVAGDRLPIFTDSEAVVPPLRAPVASAVTLPWAVAVLACATVAVVAAARVRRAVARHHQNGG
jgi:hypothetical protein